jgi:hypothetical protein
MSALPYTPEDASDDVKVALVIARLESSLLGAYDDTDESTFNGRDKHTCLFN